MSKPRRERSDVTGATAVEEPAAQEQNVGTPNGVGTDAPGEPSLVPVRQNGEGNGKRAPKREETKSQRFRRLGNMRLPKALKAIRALIPLANKTQYEYSEDERAVLIDKLTGAVEEIKLAFRPKDEKTVGEAYFR